MNSYASLFSILEAMGLVEWVHSLPQVLAARLAPEGSHGKMAGWLQALDALPVITPSHIELKDRVAIGRAEDLAHIDRTQFIQTLMAFHPWRKGPYSLFGVDIDTEWRSDWKWDRVRPHIEPLEGRIVLDVGSGNGYHGWRMRGAGADLVIGIDPTLVFVMQYQVFQRYINDNRHYVLPLGIEQLPANMQCFDTVFSMGVIYHRRSPIDHLYECRGCLRPGGQLVLETLIIDADYGTVLMPEQRYAKMRNVWFIPSVETALLWMRRCGFKQAKCVDISVTTTQEQRATAWLHFESLIDFLDPDDPSKTIEGYPAPKRAIFTAIAP